MKNLIIAIALVFIAGCQGQNQNKKTMETAENKQTVKQSIYQFKVKDIEGKEFDFATLKGKKVMVVNTASECGLTPQYEQLQKVYSEYKDKDFVIIGFPANNFGAQEPGSNQEIKAFCTKNYGVTFPMMEKISVKGEDMHPIYHFLTEKSKNGLEDSHVEWNFQKFLINENGELENVISPRVLPNDKEIIDWIKG
ncbi:putative glutathione peroxidase [Flavobacterium limnosediminis JC2902]|uniref:Glutathione peroxidase n=1 Tax=Flavobacterium limnosediminis JC2902 TaxID=1341181 RepID=V6SPX4_9FLAO|nr:glutathione peroxidase [Flavobacterium limnosediminis]ESU28656.1 putative glutathione peroxidase [Flavobacterium limnosediminis JC2902]